MAWIFIQKKMVIGHVLTRAQGSNYGTIIYIYIYIYTYMMLRKLQENKHVAFWMEKETKRVSFWIKVSNPRVVP